MIMTRSTRNRTRPNRNTRSMRGYAAAVALSLTAAAVASAAPASATATHLTRPDGHTRNVTAANISLVTTFADQLFNKANLAVIDEDTNGYIQHNPQVADGTQGLRNLVVFLHGQFPQSHTTIEQVIAQKDLVVLHDKVVSVPGGPAQSIIDIYRVENGKIVEHWDNLEPVPTDTANGHDLFSTLSTPQTPGADPHASTAVSRRVVIAYTRSLRASCTHSSSRLVAPGLIQHDPAIADGAAAQAQHYAALFAASPQAKFTVARVVAQGDLVVVHSHLQRTSTDLGQSVVDIYRVRGGRIVEHWDGIQDVPATAANTNGMF